MDGFIHKVIKFIRNFFRSLILIIIVGYAFYVGITGKVIPILQQILMLLGLIVLAILDYLVNKAMDKFTNGRRDK